MNWLKGMQKAIDYIEKHLEEPLEPAVIAREADCSGFYFQRLFGILCGCTLSEYIRWRRMSQAAAELTGTDTKIIDLAMKYGYDTPESFSRAFQRFHGILPSQARAEGAQLRSFSRLSVKIVLEGGTMMDYRIEKKEAFQILEKGELFETEKERQTQDIPQFWTHCRKEGVIDTLCRFCLGTAFDHQLLGVCYDETKQNPGYFEYAIASGYNGLPVPEGFKVREIPASAWVIFSCQGAMPEAIQTCWRRIYAEYFPTSEWEPALGIDFEVYSEGDMSSELYQSEIWIAVRPR